VIQYKFLRDEDFNIDFKGLNFFNEIFLKENSQFKENYQNVKQNVKLI
jgi:hypothetical protein